MGCHQMLGSQSDLILDIGILDSEADFILILRTMYEPSLDQAELLDWVASKAFWKVFGHQIQQWICF